ncbi:hypothetical protein [Paenirhodobacter sp.]|uniref:hypothetical protein n=1 Tax=Paenirhodobacter sp. TaxID=1965326 RepID=UPI003B41C947
MSSFHIDKAISSARSREERAFSVEDFFGKETGGMVPSDLLNPDKEGLEIVTSAELMEAKPVMH